MMVFNAIDISGLAEFKVKACMLAALLHDSGKLFTRTSHKPGRINFWGHSEAGIQFSVDTCYNLFKDDPDFEKILYCVVYAISNHVSIFENYERIVDKSSIFNDNIDLYDVLTRLMKADYIGQFSSKEDISKKNIDLFEEFANITFNTAEAIHMDDIPVVLYCGIPGVGKDYYASNIDNRRVVSLDNIRTELFIKNNPSYIYSNSKELYEFAYKYSQRKDLSKLFKEKLKENIGNKVAVCNTNVSIKARNSCIHDIRSIFNCDIGCKYIVSLEKAVEFSDDNRQDHTVGKEVIKQFSSRQSIPSLMEGFKQVELIFNKDIIK
jgi:predicted kinase